MFHTSGQKGTSAENRRAKMIEDLGNLISTIDPNSPDYAEYCKRFEALLDEEAPIENPGMQGVNPFLPITSSVTTTREMEPEKENKAHRNRVESPIAAGKPIGFRKAHEENPFPPLTPSKVAAIEEEINALLCLLDEITDDEQLNQLRIKLDTLYSMQENQAAMQSQVILPPLLETRRSPSSSGLIGIFAPPTSPVVSTSREVPRPNYYDFKPPERLPSAVSMQSTLPSALVTAIIQLRAKNAALLFLPRNDASQSFVSRMEPLIGNYFLDWIETAARPLPFPYLIRVKQQFLDIKRLECLINIVNKSINAPFGDVPEVRTISDIITRDELTPHIAEAIDAMNAANEHFTAELSEELSALFQWGDISLKIDPWFAEILCARETSLALLSSERAHSATAFELSFVTSFKKEYEEALEAVHVFAVIHPDLWEGDAGFQALVKNSMQGLSSMLHIVSQVRKSETEESLASLQAFMSLIVNHPHVADPFNALPPPSNLQARYRALDVLEVKLILLATLQAALNNGLWAVENIHNDDRFLQARALFSEDARTKRLYDLQSMQDEACWMCDDAVSGLNVPQF